jgi:hypothetical protein
MGGVPRFCFSSAPFDETKFNNDQNRTNLPPGFAYTLTRYYGIRMRTSQDSAAFTVCQQ